MPGGRTWRYVDEPKQIEPDRVITQQDVIVCHDLTPGLSITFQVPLIGFDRYADRLYRLTVELLEPDDQLARWL